MRLILTIALLLSSVNARSSSLKVQVLEGWKSTPLENCTVLLLSSEDEVIQTAQTDSVGYVKFENISYQELKVHAIDSLNRFENDLPVSIKGHNQTIVYILYPTYFYEQRMIKQEEAHYSQTDDLDSSNTSYDSLVKFSDEQSELINAQIKQFIAKNVRCPEISRELGDQGIVYVQFILESNGDMTHVKIARGVSIDLDREALRVTRAIPPFDFLPKDVRFVRARIRYPIIFTLQ